MTALIIGGIVLFIFLVSELADWMTYGGFLKKTQSEKLSEKLNQKCFSSKRTINWDYYDFASKKSGFLSRWYIHYHGDQKRIFIGSKMQKMLNDKYAELRVEEHKKTKSILW